MEQIWVVSTKSTVRYTHSYPKASLVPDIVGWLFLRYTRINVNNSTSTTSASLQQQNFLNPPRRQANIESIIPKGPR